MILAKPNEEVFFFDESRFGTHSKIGHGWFKKGSRTQVKVKLGFQNFYLYSAVNTRTGEDFTLIAPNTNTVYFNAYLEWFGQALGGRQVMMIVDGAGWHKSKDLMVPKNISIVFLPPYSPELNPVERLWRFIKDNTIKNKIFDDLDELEEVLRCFFKTLKPNIVSSICAIDYL